MRDQGIYCHKAQENGRGWKEIRYNRGRPSTLGSNVFTKQLQVQLVA